MPTGKWHTTGNSTSADTHVKIDFPFFLFPLSPEP
uniref:Uncharacterized protein n=1 Tax=Anguilla anguilla TaxID=7936 RepID=A0A0E9QJL5_ANGAN